VDDFTSGVDGIAAPDFLDRREDDGRSEFETVFYVDIAVFVVLVSGVALCKMYGTYAGRLFLSLQISQPSSNFVSLRSQLAMRNGVFSGMGKVP
jgi:hypothetical protein